MKPIEILLINRPDQSKVILDQYGIVDVCSALIDNELLEPWVINLLREVCSRDGLEFFAAILIDNLYSKILVENQIIALEYLSKFVLCLYPSGSNLKVYFDILMVLQETIKDVSCNYCNSQELTLLKAEDSFFEIYFKCKACTRSTTVQTHCRKAGLKLLYNKNNSCWKLRGQQGSYCGGIINHYQGKKICMSSCLEFGASND